MKILFTFPGQGSQTVNMLHQLPHTSSSHQLLVQASEVLDEDVLTLDSGNALKKTRAVQLCGLIAGIAYATELIEQGIDADLTSGLSIGAFPAAVFSGALSFTDAVRLVSLRGKLMEQAYPSGYGLTAIQGLYQPQVEALIAQIHSPTLPVYLANINDEDQFVIAGSEPAMQAIIKLAKEKGARKAIQLAVSVPSHCELLLEPAHQLAEAFKQVKVSPPHIAYLSGSTGRVLREPEKIIEDLAYNMARKVCWHEAMISAYERGVRLAVEMPPGSVLTGLTKKVMTEGEAISLSQSGLKVVEVLAKRLRDAER